MDNQTNQPVTSDKIEVEQSDETVIGSITDPQALNIVQSLPGQPNTAQPVNNSSIQAAAPPVAQSQQVSSTNIPSNAKIRPISRPASAIHYSAYSQSLRSYNKRLSSEKIILILIALSLASIIYYYSFYHPIGLSTNLTNMIKSVSQYLK